MAHLPVFCETEEQFVHVERHVRQLPYEESRQGDQRSVKPMPCRATARRMLADALSGSPWTAMAVHLLRRDMCTAYVEGDPSSPSASVVFWSAPLSSAPQRGLAFGPDIEALWSLLQAIGRWNAIGIHEEHAEILRGAMQRDLKKPVTVERHRYHVLAEPAKNFTHSLVRRLTEADIDLIQQAPPFLQQGRLFGGARELLQEGIFAGAIESGKLVATAHTATLTDEYAEIGVATLARYRQQGIAAAAASLVCRGAQAIGRVPVWDCAQDNEPSRHLAEKLGFVPIGTRVDLIPALKESLD